MRRISAASRIVLLLTTAVLGGTAEDITAPPEAVPLARYFPRQDLVAYAEFVGLDAHADAWKQTAAYILLNETTAGAMLESLAAQLADQASSGERSLTGGELRTIGRYALQAGFALGIVREPGQKKPSCVGLVLRGAARGEVRDLVGRLIDEGRGPGGRVEAVVKPGDRRVLVVSNPRGTGFAWWSEAEDLAFSILSPEGADAMIAALDGRVPDATEHPSRAALAKVDDGVTPVGVGFFDMAALPELPPQAAALGLDRVRRLDYRWGFQGEALVTCTRLVAPAPRVGVLALLDQPTFDPEGLPPLPPDLTGFTVWSLDPLRLYDGLAALARATDPSGEARFRRFEAVVNQATGRRLREEILDHFGPAMTLYTVPTRTIAPANPLAGLAQGLAHVPKTTLTIEVDDPQEVGRLLADLVSRVNRTFPGRGDGSDPTPAVELRPLTGDEKGYTLAVSPAVLMLPAGMKPTVLEGRRTIVLGTSLEAARTALDREGGPGGLPVGDGLAGTLEHLPADMVFLSVIDPRQSLLPELIANLPNLVQIVGSGALPSPFRPRFHRPGGREFRVAVDPDEVPAPDDLRRFLFPASYALTVDDQGFQFLTREAFPALNPAAVAPVALAALLPAAQAARMAARRAQSTNNLKQFGLALHNFHDVNGHLPPGASRDPEGKPLLSWRVALLPFLEQQALFNEFKLDEPWDSPHNQPLLARMPTIFAVPGAPPVEPGMTFYRGFSGPRTVFDAARKDGVGFASFTDGTSNTIAIVEARITSVPLARFRAISSCLIPFATHRSQRASNVSGSVGVVRGSRVVMVFLCLISPGEAKAPTFSVPRIDPLAEQEHER